MAVEVLAGMINRSTMLKGINVSSEKQIRISQYADDTILFLDGTSKSIEGAVTELLRFAHFSGLKINVEKTSCLPIGILKAKDLPADLGIKIVDELKILGTKVSTDIDRIAEENIQEKIRAIQREIEQWKRRSLTPVGKISIIKALLLSKLVHHFIALPNPPNSF